MNTLEKTMDELITAFENEQAKTNRLDVLRLSTDYNRATGKLEVTKHIGGNIYKVTEFLSDTLEMLISEFNVIDYFDLLPMNDKPFPFDEYFSKISDKDLSALGAYSFKRLNK